MSREIKPIFSKEAKSQIDAIDKQLNDMFNILEKIANTKIKFNTPKGARKETDAHNKAVNDAIKQSKMLENAYKKLQLAETEKGKKLIELRTRTAMLNAETRKQVKATLQTLSPYEKLSKRLVEAKKKAKDLGVQFGTNSKVFKKAQADVVKLDTQVKKLDRSMGDHQRNVGNYPNAYNRLRGSVSNLMGAFGAVGGIYGFVQVMKSGVNIAKKYEKANATLSGVLQVEMAQMQLLTDQSKELGATTAFTATEVTELQMAYARLGFSQQEIADMSKATIDGSIAMNAEASKTAELVGAVVNSFTDLSSTDAPQIIDVLSLSTAKSALSFEKLQTGLPIVAGAANSAGVPFNKLIALMGKLADAGIDTSSSATALRNIFIESSAQGLDYSQIIEKIKNSKDKLTTSVDEFGKRSAVSANVLAENIDQTLKLETALNSASGTADRMAKKELDTLDGALRLLSSAWEGYILDTSDANNVMGIAKKSVQFLTKNLNTILDTIVRVGKAFLTYKLVVIATSTATKAYTATTTALRLAKIALSGGIGKATRAMKLFNAVTKTSPIGIFTTALGLAIAGFVAFKDGASGATKAQKRLNKAIEDGKKEIEDYSNKIDEKIKADFEQIDLSSRKAKSMTKDELAIANITKNATTAKIDVINKEKKAIEDLVVQKVKLQAQFNKDSPKYVELNTEISELNKTYQDLQKSLVNLKITQNNNNKDLEETKKNTTSIVGSIKYYRSEISKLKKEQENAVNNEQWAKAEKQIKKYQDAIKKITEGKKVRQEVEVVTIPKMEYAPDDFLKSVPNISRILKGIAKPLKIKLDADTEALVQKLEIGKLSHKEFNAEIEKANEESNRKIADASIEAIKQVLNTYKMSAEEREEIEGELAKFTKEMQDFRVKNAKKTADEIYWTEDKIKEARDASIQAGLQAVQMIADEMFERGKVANDEELANMQARHEKELEYLEASALSDEEKKARKARLDEQYAQRERAMKQKQARADKAQALFTAIMNTALAITSALTTPPPLGFALAGIAGALGAVQIGLIASRPIPKFKKGVKNFEGGKAIVGDGGREIVKMPSGEMLLAQKEMLLNLPKGTDVLTNKETETILSNPNRKEEIQLLRDIKNKRPKKVVVHNHIKLKNNNKTYENF